MKKSDWQKYIDEDGNVEFSTYLYQTMNKLMKSILDLGTLACNDPGKLRAYKEQVKMLFREKWTDMASLLEEMGIVERCSCDPSTFCEICGGSRFVLAAKWSETDFIEEIGAAIDFNYPQQAEKVKILAEKRMERVIDGQG